MANVWYPKYKQALISGGSNTNLSTGTVKSILVDTADYTYSATHEFLSDVPSAARVAISPAHSSKTVTNGTYDAADLTLAAVTGDQSEALINYIDTGVEATSRLVHYIDSGVTGLPVTPSGSDIDIVFNASGIATL